MESHSIVCGDIFAVSIDYKQFLETVIDLNLALKAERDRLRACSKRSTHGCVIESLP